MANVLDISAPVEWIRARLLNTVSATCIMPSGDTVAADGVAFWGDPEADPPTIRVQPFVDGFSPREFLSTAQRALSDAAADAIVWPYVLISNARNAQFETCGEENVLLDGEYLIRSFHREDVAAALEGAPDVESANWPATVILQNTFQGAESPETTYGIMHGCRIMRSHQRTYGEPGLRISEIGVVVHIFST